MDNTEIAEEMIKDLKKISPLHRPLLISTALDTAHRHGMERAFNMMHEKMAHEIANETFGPMSFKEFKTRMLKPRNDNE